MHFRSIVVVIAFTLAISLVLPGCSDTKGAVGYSQQLVNAQNRMNSAAQKFVQTHNKVADEGPKHIEQLRQDHKVVQDTVAAVRAEFKTWVVPDRPSGRAFASAFDKYLITQEQIANEDFGAIVKNWEAAQMPIR